MNLNMKVGIRMGKIISLSQDRKKKKKNRKNPGSKNRKLFALINDQIKFLKLFSILGNLGLFWLFLFFFISWPSKIIFSIFIARNVLAAASKKTITKILKRGVIAVYYEK